MANGKRGDHPLTDVLACGSPGFSPEVDALLRDLKGTAVLAGQTPAFLFGVLLPRAPDGLPLSSSSCNLAWRGQGGHRVLQLAVSTYAPR